MNLTKEGIVEGVGLGKQYYCECCKVWIVNKPFTIKQHILSDAHKNREQRAIDAGKQEKLVERKNHDEALLKAQMLQTGIVAPVMTRAVQSKTVVPIPEKKLAKRNERKEEMSRMMGQVQSTDIMPGDSAESFETAVPNKKLKMKKNAKRKVVKRAGGSAV
ncbi:hypothetical protein J8273_2621 [Carpediemonas membranifera]|uniref:U1-C C2H2-type zinc finger domain-containing protein n=1 Tax=Carpediemonas membranifera TaxID=201153 RepID=A0A8J6B924_9EUKA|nr:hypothetical protein J8273_2621 [Carpediemonas membranifera]|eukprot:KAG9395714.1 hypothetical protein J8273_2621 [Carpediemonas membranifera]